MLPCIFNNSQPPYYTLGDSQVILKDIQEIRILKSFSISLIVFKMFFLIVSFLSTCNTYVFKCGLPVALILQDASYSEYFDKIYKYVGE